MPKIKPIEALPDEYPPNVDLDEQGKFYKKPYSLNAVGKDGLTVTVAIPREIVKRAAEKKGLLPKEFLKTHRAIIVYNAFDGAFIRFEEEPKIEKEK